MSPRTYPVPARHRGGVLGSVATLDQIDLAATMGDTWATKVLATENARTLGPLLGQDRRLPEGIVTDGLITGLWRGGLTWRTGPTVAAGWVEGPIPAETELLDADTCAFVARALEEGRPVLTYPYTPLALLSASYPDPAAPVPAPPDSSPLPPGSKVLAVVDEFDRNAVMDLVVVLPGPKVMRRHDGQWRDDPAWLSVLRSVRPPPVVELKPEQIDNVVAQIDEATKGAPFDKTEKEQAGKDKAKPVKASAWDERADDMRLAWALLAAPVGKALSQATPGGRMPHELKSYWSVGPGAAKIRWNTPGAMTRCARYLAKYVGPHRAYSTCNNIGKLRGGRGVAWDVKG